MGAAAAVPPAAAAKRAASPKGPGARGRSGSDANDGNKPPLSEAMAAFEGYPTCPEWSNRIAVVECGLPLAEWVDGALDISVDVVCESPDVIGPLGTDPMQIGAFAAFEEDLKGSLKAGKLADITVLSKDILTVPEEEIPSTEILYTIVGGKVLYKGK